MSAEVEDIEMQVAEALKARHPLDHLRVRYPAEKESKEGLRTQERGRVEDGGAVHSRRWARRRARVQRKA